MKIIEQKLEGVVEIIPDIHKDGRGSFLELYNGQKYDFLPLKTKFVQENLSISSFNTLRGLHFQVKKPQGKLVSCIQGSVLDVVVDINPASKTFGDHLAIELNCEQRNQLWVPPGFAHGFYVTSKKAMFYYKCTNYYDPLDESGLIWNDAMLSIGWPTNKPNISQKDSLLQSFNEYISSQALK